MDRLPVPATPFVRRIEELAEIAALLADPACRLLTLVGPGGIGKTRLAIEVARQLPSAGGVHFVALQPLTSPDFILSTMADALDFHFNAGSDPRQQLFDYLREKALLLVLDNFEHLLDGAPLLSEMLAAAPGVRLLVTSRERLNLVEEWVLELGGLAYPSSEAGGEAESYSAVALFAQQAQRAKVGFSLSDVNRSAVVRICRLVDGMPLGIELAANWVRALSCAAIADEIERSLDILETPARNVEPRHRTMRAAFAPTWEWLAEQERDVFMRLSVFRGGFTREAAGASLRTLTALVDRSLVRVDASGRYDLHELLRQYAAETLVEAGETEQTARQHCQCFLKLAEQAEAHVWGREQQSWYDRLEIELDNLRAALEWSLHNSKDAEGLRLATALGWFMAERSHSQEGLVWLERVIAATPGASTFLQSKARHRAAEIANFLNQFTYARTLCEQSLAIARAAGDRWNIAWALGNLAYADAWQHPERTVSLLDDSLALFREIGDEMGVNHLLRRRAQVAYLLKDYVYARLLFEEALVGARAAGDQNAVAQVLNNMGDVIWLQDQDLYRAAQFFESGASLFLELHNPHQAAIALANLADAERHLGNRERAETVYKEALRLLRSVRSDDRSVFAGLANIAIWRGDFTLAAWLLAGADAQSLVLLETHYPEKITFHSDVAAVRAELGEVAFALAWAEGKAMTTQQLIDLGLQSKPGEPSPAKQADNVSRTQHRAISQSPVDPLTPRELEILRLVADGLTNGEIAARLVLAIGTVKWYLNLINGKLDTTNRTQAVARARSLDLLD